ASLSSPATARLSAAARHMPAGPPPRSPPAPGRSRLLQRLLQLLGLFGVDPLGEPAECRCPVRAGGEGLAHQVAGVLISGDRRPVPVGAAPLFPGPPPPSGQHF